jgi:hypothetical protein
MKFYKVKSFTEPEVEYTVRNFGEGEYRCDCPAFVFSEKECKHIASIRYRYGRQGQKNGMYKGESVGYAPLHRFVRRRLQKPKVCPNCRKRPPHDLTNKRGNYNRDFSEWEWLCRRCHMIKDGRIELLEKTQFKKGVTPWNKKNATRNISTNRARGSKETRQQTSPKHGVSSTEISRGEGKRINL